MGGTRLLVGVLVLSACGAPAAPARVPPTAPMDVARIVSADGRAVSFDAMIDALLDARVVYVGEQHDRAADHRAQAAILEALHARDGSIAIGLEMVQHPYQDALDAYVAGTIEEAEMLAGVEWESRWRVDFAHYRPLVAHARAHGLPLVALNAPAELTRAIAQSGLTGLDDAQRALLPELDLGDAVHRAMVEEALRQHPGLDDERLERYYAAQVVWDETMADRVARTLLREDAPARMLVLAGAMHVRPPAIPARAARRGARPFAVVVPVPEAELDDARRADPPLGDFLWVIPDS